MRFRCRIGIHEWAHLGYSRVNHYWDGDFECTKWKSWQKCTACGQRRKKRHGIGVPPDFKEIR